jgi:hypothetical protein
VRVFDDLNIVGRELRVNLPARDERSEIACAEPVNLRLAVLKYERAVETDHDLTHSVARECAITAR